MKIEKLFLVAGLTVCAAACVLYGAPGSDAAPLPRSSPEAQGIPSNVLRSLYVEMHSSVDSLHSMMILRHGHVVAEGWWAPYRAETPHVLYSLSKSFASTAIGLAQAEGLLSIDDPVLKFFPEGAPEAPSKYLQEMRVRDLLTMSTGHHADAIKDFPYLTEANLPRRFLDWPIAHKPGTHFVYNTPGSFMLSAIVQKATGQRTVDYLGPRLFEPLGIAPPEWIETVDGISLGGWGLSLRTEDIATFGQLMLQKGEWKGRRLLPSAWVELAASRQTSNGSNPDSDWEQGYGFQFWRCRHGAYRGDGAFGQYCIVMPEHGMVIAITAGTGSMARAMDLLWERLLPEIRPAALPPSEKDTVALKRLLASLELPRAKQTVAPLSPNAFPRRIYRLDENPQGIEAVGLRPMDGGVELTLRSGGIDFRVPCGYEHWIDGGEYPPEARDLVQLRTEPVSGSAGWQDKDTLVLKLCLSRTPFVATLTFRFEDDRLSMERRMNVAFGGPKPETFSGRAEQAQ